ncbi:hypothetical protein WN59_00610 [Salinicoccus sediminis]|uniref:Nuclease SbcCD subunit C n=1 Tax=Salinicoccus sediminis TaxID=1432562 RepID=A0A0M2SQW9_9STAP|nr:SMC family ATPase [Salinicoccus sediminis]KKK35372.1 hypothetical protein WN59_00610 [Salinicoccus sediminis]
MKPIRLDMKYFGPFEDESIDFSSIKDSMFLISGRTGSGKTMIFDAITYALYGTLSTSDRMEGSVRSQFATDSDISRVKLTFEIRGSQYTVERTLSYQKEGRKTPVPPKAAIYDQEGEVLEGSINGVKEKVLGIIGLDADQFRQILILPQGEFKRLLVSSSESKQEILRTLFRTERFVHFEMRLNELKKEKLKSIELVESRVEELFSTLSANGDAELQKLIDAEYPTAAKRIEVIEEIGTTLGNRYRMLEEALQKLKQEATSLRETISRRERHNEQALKLASTKQELKDHEENAASIERLETAVRQYRKVKTVEYELRSEQDLIKQKEELETRLNTIDTGLKELETSGEALRQTLDKISRYREGYTKLVKWINSTERFVEDPRFRDMDGVLQSKMKERQNLASDIKAQEAKLAEVRQEDDSIHWEHAESEILRNELSASVAECRKMREWIERENKSAGYDGKKQTLEKEITELRKKMEDTETAIKKIQEDTGSMYSPEDKVHIEHLAGHLKKDGECPVCRQTVSVLPVARDYMSEEDEAELRALETKKQECGNALETAEKNLGIVDGILGSMERYDTEKLEKELEAEERHQNEVRKKIDDNHKRYDRKKQLDEEMRRLESSISDNRIRMNNAENAVEQQKSLKKEFSEQTQFETCEEFQREFQARQQKVSRYEKQQEEAEQERQRYREEKSRLEENRAAARRQLSEMSGQLEENTRVIDDFLKDNEFAGRNVLFSILKNTDVNEDEERIRAYHTQKDILKSRINDLESVLESTEEIPVEEDREKLSVLDKEIETKTNDNARLYARMQHNGNIKEKISDFAEKHEAELGEVDELVELVNAVSGKNEQKVSLERFVLTYYLDRILHIANIRLLEMTSHRYELRRSTGKSNRKTGLDIEVFDFYNNRARHISSLSGGETFQASLTLALALNEALQQESGGISLDTMLIDEGFGTLDPETLDMAISTLIELQTSGKMVGIISHVEELKERMENILEVKAVNERSTANFK